MVSNGEATGIFTGMSIFVAKAIRLLLWTGGVLAVVLSVVFFFMAFSINPESSRNAVAPALMIEQTGYFLVSATWLGIALSGMVLAIVLQAIIVFFEHARNQFVTASAMQLIKAERDSAAPN